MIQVENLEKRFGRIHAVRGVSFSVQKGDVLGFLGPNGAGKSTSMRMITGFLPPSGGKVTIGGFDIEEQPEDAKRLFGYLPENAPLYPDMTVEAFLRFACAVKGLPADQQEQSVETAIATCHLEKVRHQLIDTLSKGYRHRTCFAQAILGDPPILILDEPTDGLDPNQKHEMRQLIKTMGQTKAIIVSTHILEEVEAICNRVIIIDRGQLVFNGTPAELLAKAPETGRVIVKASNADFPALEKALAALPSAHKVMLLGQQGAKLRLAVEPKHGADGLAAQVARKLCELKVEFEELHTDSGRLDEVFRNLTSSDNSTEANK
jgi:ABC-2 type transport system ATP-binding protein